jgi:hypothetical protein
MFRLIGWVVFIFVLIVGFRPLKAWYEGRATPDETVQKMRTDLGQAISPRSGQMAESEAPVMAGAPDDGGVRQVAPAPTPATDDTESMAHSLLQQATRQSEQH